ncbi:MAG: hypothetical protein WDO13_01290 [Verrucomicrobiota bacterium]
MPTPPVKFPKPNRSTGKPPVRKSDGNGSNPGPAGDQNWRGITLLSLTVLSMLALYYALIHPGIAQQEITKAQLFDYIKEGRVTSIVNEPDPSSGVRTLTGTYKKPVSSTPGASEVEAGFKVPVDLQLDPNLAQEIKDAGYKASSRPRTTPTSSGRSCSTSCPSCFSSA